MPVAGNLRKMRVEYASPVRYFLRVGEERVPLNERLGQTISLKFSGSIHCIACGRETKRSFNQGHCFPCFRKLASCDRCIVSPELCHFHLGTCREPVWAKEHCMQPHVVYLANSSGLKVGITRAGQIPTRWIDQGATQALPMLKVASRRASGLIESVLKAHVADRTDWRKMLKGPPEPVDLVERAEALLPLCQSALSEADPPELEGQPEFIAAVEKTFDYPVLEYPEKVRSINAEKEPSVSGTLLGIKGQYLLLDTGVINLRKYTGYQVSFD